MAVCCIFVAVTSVATMVLFRGSMKYFMLFELITKLVTTVTMFLAFKFYKWDVAKGLMGGVLFCLMYQEGYLVLLRLWGEQDFDTYLVVGVQGSLYLAAAGMSFLMTIIITVNHFFINYTTSGNPKNVTFNRIAIFFQNCSVSVAFGNKQYAGIIQNVALAECAAVSYGYFRYSSSGKYGITV